MKHRPITAATLRLLRRTAVLLVNIAAAILLTAAIAAARLSAGPVDITLLVQHLAQRAHRPLAIGLSRATLGWDGWRHPEAPLVLALGGLTLRAPGGQQADHLDHASVSLSLPSLLHLDLLPTALIAENGALSLHRNGDGTIELAPGFPLTGKSKQNSPPILRALSEIHLANLTIDLTDARSSLSAHIARADVTPRSGTLAADLSAGVHTTLDATLSPAGGNRRLDLRFGPIDPQAAAALLPAAALLHAPLTAAFTIDLDHDLQPLTLTANLALAAGFIHAAGGDIPITGGRLHATLVRTGRTSGNATADAAISLAGPDTPTLSAHLSLAGDAAPHGHLAGAAEITGTPLPIPALRTWWPPDLARGGRQWTLQNLTAGTATHLDVHATLASDTGITGLGLDSVTGGFDGNRIELHWLRPIAPITDAAAHLQIDDGNSLTIVLQSGRQGALDVSGTRMRITGLNAQVQPADIDARIRGPLTAVLAVLNEQRLHLLSRQPIPLDHPSGTVDARLHVALPLDDRVTMEQVVIGAHVALAHVHLGDVALGRAIDDGRFTLDADTDGLLMRGDATFAQLPVNLSIGLDFRAGPPDQVTEHVQAHTTADAATVARASTDFGRMRGGIVTLAADYGLRRDRTANLALDADFGSAALETPFGWDKPAGPPATLHANLQLVRGTLSAIDQLAAHGPALDIATHGIAGPHGLAGLGFDRIVIGRTDAAGRLDFPAANGGPFRLFLSGPELDLAALFRPATAPTGKPPPPAPPNPHAQPWSARLAFARVTLAHHVDVGGLHATLAGSGAHLATADATATGPVPMTASLRPAQGGRALAIDTADAGHLLSAFDVTDRIEDGDLSLAATLPGPGPGQLDGTVRLDRFTLRRVPAVVLLLRDLTVYGLADPAPKPNISVSTVVVPFHWRAGVLTLDRARASQPALGMTARGTVDTNDDRLDLSGTIVPAYVFNTLPGRIPVVGRLFSPERGGGLFAATFTLKGPADHPSVTVNPLAALLPGVLRDLLPH